MPVARGSEANFDNGMTTSIRGKTHETLMSICFFTITKPETGQMPGINIAFERQVSRVQVADLHSAGCATSVVNKS